ncbi:hypothetical protein GFS03_03590 [Sulfolobus sp. E5-1-F]|uniref:hypothetical protein n=1 Tax=Sulfolobaceae TaxID=118883 RepID=UPI00129695C1|nr:MULTISPECIES: hypothetical protein [unclassified Sulfolobus]QGA53738.1 hypothetical protein GFS03_03590 [Sulfolobus sp. E5-1-F]QGA68607.1 hypothetical protein GFS33_07630 [Sulfolobus sp. E11-6]
MQHTTKALIIGIVAGILLISMVASLTFQYTAARDVNATVVADPSANINLVANDTAHGWSSTGIPFVNYNSSGDLQINFGDVATYANETLLYAFDVSNDLNTTATITITVMPVSVPSGTNLYILTPSGPSTSYMFTLAAGHSQSISLRLATGGTQGHAKFLIIVTATS